MSDVRDLWERLHAAQAPALRISRENLCQRLEVGGKVGSKQ
ncbi:MAG: hypothetical protein U9R02_11710 [Thermodesulfobacteriota bacterium]|nr:hypothetical protein [Thermodesulfobacteriota bacterium]